MSFLSPMALPPATAAMLPVTHKTSSGLPPAATNDPGTPVNSFQSLLKQSSAALNNDAEPEASPSERALKSGQDTNALLAGTSTVPVAQPESQPLPFKWSLNIFGNTAEPKNLPSEQPVGIDSPSLKQNSPAAPLTTSKPQLLSGAPAAASKPQLLSAISTGASKPQSQPATTPRMPSQQPATVENSGQQSPPSVPIAKSALPQNQETLSGDDSDASQQTQSPAAPQLPVSMFAATPASVPALPVAVTPPTNNAAPAPAPKAERARSQKTSSPQPSNASPVAAPPQTVLPAALTTLTPVSDQANAAPTQTAKPGSVPSPSAPEPRLEQSHVRVVAQGEASPKQATPELAFALRVQPDSASATAVGVNATPAASGAQSVTSSIPYPPQNTAPAQPATAPPRPTAAAAPAASVVQNAQSSADQSAGADTGSAPKDTDPRHADAALTAEPVASPTSAGPESQTLYAHAAPSSEAPSAPAATPPGAPQTVAAAASSVPLPTASAPRTGTANQISISVPTADQQNVQVRLMDRAGEVHVTVRAPNEELAGNLRSDLTSLTGKLNQSGFSTEAFTPSRGGEFSRDQRSADPQQQNGAERQTSGRNQQQQSSQQNARGNRPAWLDEFEGSMAN